MFKKRYFAMFVASVCANAYAVEAEPLKEISVIAKADNSHLVDQTTLTQQQINQKQAKDIKGIFADSLDVSVADLQGARSGNVGVNVRGLDANRVSTSVDGIELPETQESLHFISYGMEFGRGDYVEPTALSKASVNYGGSARTLSAGVNFETLTPQDLLKGRQAGGFLGTGYSSQDRSTYLTAGGALEAGNYQGMVMSTVRLGNEKGNQGKNDSWGAARTKADPADSRNVYILTKHNLQLNDHNQLKFTLESQRKKVATDLLSKNGTKIDTGTGVQLWGDQTDRVSRERISLGHEYQNNEGPIQTANTLIYFQNAKTENDRLRSASRDYRHETSENREKTYGIHSDFVSEFATSVPQAVRYGLSFAHTEIDNRLDVERSSSYYATTPSNRKPSANAKQDKFTAYLEDSLAFGSLVVTPHLGVVHYRVNPSMDGNYVQAGGDNVKVQKQSETKLAPKLALEWRVIPEFMPFFEYSRGIKTPSSQQLNSSFGEIVSFPVYQNGRPVIVNGRPQMQTVQVAVVGNPNLKSEIADNFELGFKGKNDNLEYSVAGYYNRYKNFIDWQNMKVAGYTQFVQYQNSDKAKIYGVTAQAKWKFYQDFVANAGIAFAKGNETNQGEKAPINSIQPLKTKLGLGYEGETFGTNVQWTYVKGKKDKDIKGNMYNPTGGYSVFDLGVYYKPVKDLTLTANLNNVFNKKYWNWNDISYLALLKADGASGGHPPIGIDAQNADRYTAPDRNVNVGLRYEF